MTMIPTTGITFKVDGVRHPCRVQFYINGVPVTDLGVMEENENIKITSIAADRIGVEALEDGVDVTVTARLRCPPDPDLDAIVIADVGPLPPPTDVLEIIRRWVMFPFWLVAAGVAWLFGGPPGARWCGRQFPPPFTSTR